jgi:hypothetical protein
MDILPLFDVWCGASLYEMDRAARWVGVSTAIILLIEVLIIHSLLI